MTEDTPENGGSRPAVLISGPSATLISFDNELTEVIIAAVCSHNGDDNDDYTATDINLAIGVVPDLPQVVAVTEMSAISTDLEDAGESIVAHINNAIKETLVAVPYEHAREALLHFLSIPLINGGLTAQEARNHLMDDHPDLRSEGVRNANVH